MKNFKLYGVISMIMCSLAIVCHATEPKDLYTGTVPVESQQASARDVAMQQAFVQVLIKLSGDSHAVQKGTLPSPTQASQWVQQFRYETKPALKTVKMTETIETTETDEPTDTNEATETTETTQTAAAPTLWLEAKFDQDAINNYFKRNNIPMWTGVRPKTLVWMAVEENGTQAIVGEYELAVAHWQQLFMEDSQARAVPVLFPLLDLTDKQQIELNDVWYHVSESLKQSATRYQADNVLSGRVYTNLQTGHWVGDWLLTLPTEEVSWRQEGSTPEELIQGSVDRFVNEMAQRAEKSQTATEPSNLVLNVDNVTDMQSYLRVVAYLQSLSILENVVPIQITPRSVSFRVKLISPLPVFEEQMMTGQLLRSIAPMSDNVLYYQYL